ncbi:MAG: hypothetical protein P4N59_00610 [Negativicutes bacterium]|nr:hypothetical protein [Negativicutes bacterium]
MKSRSRIHAAIREYLPGADKTLVKVLTQKAELEIGWTKKTDVRKISLSNETIERLIKREEMIELGLKVD